MMNKAVGTFHVKISSLPPYNTSADAKLARMSIDKQFHGDLEATSQGEMLSAGTDTKTRRGTLPSSESLELWMGAAVGSFCSTTRR
jgi:hypothetical protein